MIWVMMEEKILLQKLGKEFGSRAFNLAAKREPLIAGIKREQVESLYEKLKL